MKGFSAHEIDKFLRVGVPALHLLFYDPALPGQTYLCSHAQRSLLNFSSSSYGSHFVVKTEGIYLHVLDDAFLSEG